MIFLLCTIKPFAQPASNILGIHGVITLLQTAFPHLQPRRVFPKPCQVLEHLCAVCAQKAVSKCGPGPQMLCFRLVPRCSENSCHLRQMSKSMVLLQISSGSFDQTILDPLCVATIYQRQANRRLNIGRATRHRATAWVTAFRVCEVWKDKEAAQVASFDKVKPLWHCGALLVRCGRTSTQGRCEEPAMQHCSIAKHAFWEVIKEADAFLVTLAGTSLMRKDFKPMKWEKNMRGIKYELIGMKSCGSVAWLVAQTI